MIPTPSNEKSFGGVIRWNRRSRGLTLKQVAEKMGYSVVYQSELERGLKIPTEERVKQLSKLFRLNAKRMESLIQRNVVITKQEYSALTKGLKSLASTVRSLDELCDEEWGGSSLSEDDKAAIQLADSITLEET